MMNSELLSCMSTEYDKEYEKYGNDVEYDQEYEKYGNDGEYDQV